MTSVSRERRQELTSVGIGSVGYLFGLLMAEALPGTILVPLLGDLGMTTSAARTMLHRMRVSGAVTTERVGRIVVYRLAHEYLSYYRAATRPVSRPAWDGFFHAVVYEIPETERAERDALRARAFQAGYGALRSGLLIGMSDPQSWVQAWRDAEGCFVETVQLRCTLPAAARLANRAWALADLGDRLTALRASLADALDVGRSRAVEGPEALSMLHGVWKTFVSIEVATPALPAALYPSRWDRLGIEQLMHDVNDLLLPSARQHARAAVARSGSADRLVLDPEAVPATRMHRLGGVPG